MLVEQEDCNGVEDPLGSRLSSDDLFDGFDGHSHERCSSTQPVRRLDALDIILQHAKLFSRHVDQRLKQSVQSIGRSLRVRLLHYLLIAPLTSVLPSSSTNFHLWELKILYQQSRDKVSDVLVGFCSYQ